MAHFQPPFSARTWIILRVCVGWGRINDVLIKEILDPGPKGHPLETEIKDTGGKIEGVVAIQLISLIIGGTGTLTHIPILEGNRILRQGLEDQTKVSCPVGDIGEVFVRIFVFGIYIGNVCIYLGESAHLPYKFQFQPI
jgi:hypothetical protein